MIKFISTKPSEKCKKFFAVMPLVENFVGPPNELFYNSTTLNIPSNWANLANFLVFDVILITLVFAITSDLAGRLNGWSLSDGKVHPLYILSPPVVGGGLSSIRKFRGYALAFVRLFALVLVLVSNACIEGSDVFLAKLESRQILTIGNVLNITETQYENNIMLRSGCRKQLRDGHTLYGDLRVLPDGTIQCVTDERLLRRPFITSGYVNVSLDTGICEPARKVLSKIYRSHLVFNITYRVIQCERATLRCIEPNAGLRLVGETCRGIVKGRSENSGTYLCDEGEISVGNIPIRRTCLGVENLDFRTAEWVDAAMFFSKVSPYLIDEIMAMFAVLPVRKDVLVETRTPVTYISPMWFVVMSLKLMILVGLVLSSGWLWKNGYSPVAHDEPRLADLILAGLEEIPQLSSFENSESDNRSVCSSSGEIRITGRKTRSSRIIVSAIGYNEFSPSVNEEKDEQEREFW